MADPIILENLDLQTLWAIYEDQLKRNLTLGDDFVVDGNFTTAERAMLLARAEELIAQAGKTGTPEAAAQLATLPSLDLSKEELIRRITDFEQINNLAIRIPETVSAPTQPQASAELTPPPPPPPPAGPVAQETPAQAQQREAARMNTPRTPADTAALQASLQAPTQGPVAVPAPAGSSRADLQTIATGTLTPQARTAIDALGNRNGTVEPEEMFALNRLVETNPGELRSIADMVRAGATGEPVARPTPAPTAAAHIDPRTGVAPATSPLAAPANDLAARLNAPRTSTPAETLAEHINRRTDTPASLTARLNATPMPAPAASPAPASPPATDTAPIPADAGDEHFLRQVNAAAPTPPAPSTPGVLPEPSPELLAAHALVTSNLGNEAVLAEIAKLDGEAGLSTTDLNRSQLLMYQNPQELLRIAATLRESGTTAAADVAQHASATVQTTPTVTPPGQGDGLIAR